MSVGTAFELDAFSAWFAESAGVTVPVTVEPMKGGGSCEMFAVTRSEPATGKHADRERWVIRRAPLTVVSASAHQVVREAQIMASLAPTPVPVPEVVGVEESGEVLGAPFFVMKHVEGAVVRRSGLPRAYVEEPTSHPAVGEGLIDTLVDLHAVDWQSTALADLSKPDGFLERQVQRWLGQLNSYRNRDLPDIDSIAEWLEQNRPATGDLSVMHGDYKLANLMLSPTTPPKVVSLVDFEMTTVGDPLIDLAWALIFWPEEGNLIALAAPGTPGGFDPQFCQTPAELANRYAAATGRDMTAFDWYQAFSAWKLAIVLEASYAKFLSGDSHNPHHEFFGMVVEELLKRARRFAA